MAPLGRVLVGEEKDSDARATGDEEGEGGADGEGEGDVEEEEEGEGALARRVERNRGNAPEWFHARVSSPPSKSSSSEEENASSSMSVSPGLSTSSIEFPDAAVAAVVVSVSLGRL